jgi:Tol biopolymer transport system component
MAARSPVWSPDGSLIAFLVTPDKVRPMEQEVWISRITEASGAARQFTKIKLPRLATNIAGWISDNRIGLLCLSPFRNAIYTVPLSGGKATQVTPETWAAFLPQWSPDGERIYFRMGQGDIAFVPAGGGMSTVLSQEGDKVIETLPGGGNHISPDGKRIAFSGYREGVLSARLWTMPITGGQPVRLPMKPDLDAWQPRWSPDGKWIAFESERDVPGERKLDENIFIVSSEGGEPRQLTHHTDCFCELEAWSPRGDSIAYACSDKTIRIIPAAGGESRTVLKTEGIESHEGSLAWTPDGSRLLYTAKGQLWTVSTSGGELTAIKTDMDGNILQFALSPDGQTIAFNVPSGGDPELWFMEDFLSLVKR